VYLPALTWGIILLAALFSFRSINDLDYGIHIATGRWILDNGEVPLKDPFSWSFSGHSYIAYHWGFQVIAAYFERLCGTLGPVLLRTTLVTLAALIIAKTLLNRKASSLVAISVGFLAVIVAEWRFSIRPELFTDLLLAATVLLVDMRRRGSTVALYFIPFVFLVWVNTHIYILGFVILGFELIFYERKKGLDIGLLAATLVSIATLFANPYGSAAVLEPIRLFSRINGSSIFAHHITELGSPWDLLFTASQGGETNASILSWALLLALSVPAAVGLHRTKRYSDLAVLLTFGLISTLAIRNISLIAFTAIPALAVGLSYYADKVPRRLRALSPYAFLTVGLIVSLTGVRVATGAWYYSHRQPIHTLPLIENTALAVEAASFVRKQGLKGRCFNNLNVGGTLLLFAPGTKIYIDGRNEVTGDSFFASYLEALKPENFSAFTERERIEFAVLSHKEMAPLIRAMISSRAWKIVHFDSVATVLVKADGINAHIPQSPLPAPIPSEEIRWRSLFNIVVRPSLIDSFARWLLGSEQMASDQSQRGVFLLTIGQWKEAEPLLLEAATSSPNYWELSSNLGALYTRLNLPEAAAFAYRTVLMLNPENELAKIKTAENWNRFVSTTKVTP
jgi:hypothetical protein